MKTSCFFTYNDTKNKGVGIALKSPEFFKGEEYFDLAPTPEILSNWRKYKDEKRYKKEYFKMLSRLNPEKVSKDLKGKVLLCWERKGDFCHRRLVAKWLKKELGIKVKEV